MKVHLYINGSRECKATFINSPSGTGYGTNCLFVETTTPMTEKLGKFVSVVATKDIEVDQELFFDYGAMFKLFDETPVHLFFSTLMKAAHCKYTTLYSCSLRCSTQSQGHSFHEGIVSPGGQRCGDSKEVS